MEGDDAPRKLQAVLDLADRHLDEEDSEHAESEAEEPRRELPGTLAISLVLLGVVLVQMAVGETQWRTQLPWGLVLLTCRWPRRSGG